MAEIKGLINAKGKGGSATPTKIFIADADYITITQDDLGSWSFPSSEIEDIEFLTPQSEDYPTESDFADGDLLYVYSEEVVEEDGDTVEIKKTLKEIYEVRYIEDNSVVLQKRILMPQSSGGGGKQLYQHNIRIYSSDTLQELLLKIINDNNTQFDLTSLNTWLLNNGFSETANNYYECSGGKTTGGGSQTFFIMGVCYNNSDNTTLKIRGGQYTTMGTWSIALSSVNIKDTIIPL